MDVVTISKEKGEAIVKLRADELVKLCNALDIVNEEQKDGTYWNLYNELMILVTSANTDISTISVFPKSSNAESI